MQYTGLLLIGEIAGFSFEAIPSFKKNKKYGWRADYLYIPYNFLTPKKAPAAIRNPIPPSIGTQGGSQQGGSPQGPPPPGGGPTVGCAQFTNASPAVNESKKTRSAIERSFNFISI